MTGRLEMVVTDHSSAGSPRPMRWCLAQPSTRRSAWLPSAPAASPWETRAPTRCRATAKDRSGSCCSIASRSARLPLPIARLVTSSVPHVTWPMPSDWAPRSFSICRSP